MTAYMGSSAQKGGNGTNHQKINGEALFLDHLTPFGF